MSTRLRVALSQLEHPDDRYWPGTLLIAIRQWQRFVRYRYRRLWIEDDGGCGYWECCTDPWKAREVLDEALFALPHHHQAEFRQFLAALDDLY